MCVPLIVAGAAAAASAGGAAAAGAAVGSATMWASAIAGAAAGLSSGAQYEAAKFNEKLAGQQKESLENDAKNTRIAGAQESAQALQQSQKTNARNAVQYAAGGVDIASGTAGQVGEATAVVGALEQLTVLRNADVAAMGLENEGFNLLQKAKSDKKNAKLNMATTILTSAASGAMGALSAPASAGAGAGASVTSGGRTLGSAPLLGGF